MFLSCVKEYNSVQVLTYIEVSYYILEFQYYVIVYLYTLDIALIKNSSLKNFSHHQSFLILIVDVKPQTSLR